MRIAFAHGVPSVRTKSQTHQCVMRPLWVHCHTQITQTDGNGMEGEGQWAKCFMEAQPVIGRLWINNDG